VKKTLSFTMLIGLLITFSLSACGQTDGSTPEEDSAIVETEVIQVDTATVPPPSLTFTPTSTATATQIPTPTPLPGAQVFPLDSFDEGVPWLPYDNSHVPAVYFINFNVTKPPFDNILVRQAFAAAIDRDAVVEITEKYFSPVVFEPSPATNITPPEVLGRDVYNEIGIPFDPEYAKEVFTQAGYEDPSGFPNVTLLVNVSNNAAKGIHLLAAEKMTEMWKEYLGVDVLIEILTYQQFKERIVSDPPELFRVAWVADFNDPSNFLSDLFDSSGGRNFGGYSNSDYYDLIQRASEISDPGERQLLYLEAERILCEIDPVVIPIYHGFYDLR